MNQPGCHNDVHQWPARMDSTYRLRFVVEDTRTHYSRALRPFGVRSCPIVRQNDVVAKTTCRPVLHSPGADAVLPNACAVRAPAGGEMTLAERFESRLVLRKCCL